MSSNSTHINKEEIKVLLNYIIKNRTLGFCWALLGIKRYLFLLKKGYLFLYLFFKLFYKRGMSDGGGFEFYPSR